jgi:hypothetical protein
LESAKFTADGRFYHGGVQPWHVNYRMAVTSSIGSDFSFSGYNSGAGNAGGCFLARVEATANSLFSGYYGALNVGTITTNGTGMVFNSASDVRLKTNIVDAADAGDLIDGMQVRSFDWRSDGSHQRYGFIAQELHEVAPEAVTVGDIWMVDPSKLVPLLVKELQGLRARVAALEAKLA